MKTYKQILLILISATVFSTACGSLKFISFNADQSRADKVVEKFHQLYNEQNFEEIYNSAHENAKATKSKEALSYFLAQTFEQFGKNLSSELIYSKVTIINSAERQVECAYKSKFEKGERNETFLIVTNDEKGALYSIGEATDEELKKLK